MEIIEEEKQSLINVIEWYRDKYRPRSCYSMLTDLIEQVKKCQSQESLELFHKVVDGWLDY